VLLTGAVVGAVYLARREGDPGEGKSREGDRS